MLVTGSHFAQHRGWIAVVVVATIAVAAWYAFACAAAEQLLGGSSATGLIYGTVGGLIILFEFALWPRKKVRVWRIGRAQTWMRAHIWLGLLTVPLIVLHTGFRFGGWLPTVLMLLFIVVILSGVWGLILQQYIPRTMYEQVPAETIHTQIEFVADQLDSEARTIVQAVVGRTSLKSIKVEPAHEEDFEVSGYRPWQAKTLERNVAVLNLAGGDPHAVGALEELYRSEIGPFLRGEKRGASSFAATGRAERVFEDMRRKLGPGGDDVVEALGDLCRQRRELEFQKKLHGWLHAWLLVHLPLSAALVVLMFAHIWFALKYL